MQPRTTGKRSWSYSRKGKERVDSHSRRIKIFKGRVRSGSVTKTGNQLWVPITEKTANQPYIVEAVTHQLGRGRWALVSPDGLEIKDMPGTRGIYNNIIKMFSFPTSFINYVSFFRNGILGTACQTYLCHSRK